MNLSKCAFVSRCFCADADDFRNEFKVPPFQDCILSFLGFSDEEKTSMEEMTEMQGKKARCVRRLGDEGLAYRVCAVPYIQRGE